MVALVAAEADSARERGEEPVGAHQLGDAVEHEHGTDGDPAVELGAEKVGGPAATARSRRAGSRRPPPAPAPPARRRGRRPEPLHDPVAAAVLEGEEEPEGDEREGEPVVQPGLGGDGEVRLPLVLLPRRPDSDVAGQHRVGGRERRAEDDGRGERKPHHADAEQGYRGDGQRHDDAEQARDRAPRTPRKLAVELQPRGEERDDDRELGEAHDDLGVVDRVEPGDLERTNDDRGHEAEREVDERRGERALVLVRERADRGEDGDPEEGEREDVRVPEVEPRSCYSDERSARKRHGRQAALLFAFRGLRALPRLFFAAFTLSRSAAIRSTGGSGCSSSATSTVSPFSFALMILTSVSR